MHESTAQFVAKVKTLSSHYNDDSILNTDQLCLALEIPSTRTLSFLGEKTTLATVRSINNTTHNYTVQPIISISGKIIGPVYVCLKEVNGRMSENIRANLLQMKNVVVNLQCIWKADYVVS